MHGGFFGGATRPCLPGVLSTTTARARRWTLRATQSPKDRLDRLQREKDEARSLSRFRTLWTVVDASAWLGALGTAFAFVATQEALLIAGPLVLPLVALYASKERSGIDARFSQQRVERQFARAVRQLVALSEEGTAEVIEEVAAGMKAVEAAKESTDASSKASLEATSEAYLEEVRALTGSLRTSLREGDEEITGLVRRSTDVVGEGFKKLRGDIAADLRAATSEEVAALERLDARIAGLEEAVTGLDSRQADSFRRLTASLGSLSSSLDQDRDRDRDRSLEEDAIAAVVKEEVWRSLEPVRQLPQVLRDAGRALPGDELGNPMLTEEAIKKILGVELENLKKSLVSEGEDLLEDVRRETENLVVRVEGAQWGQLLGGLEALDAKLREVVEDREDGREMNREDLVRGLAREVREVREAVAMLTGLEGIVAGEGSGEGNLTTALPRQEALRAELTEALRGLHRREFESSEAFAEELSEAVVDVLVRVLRAGPSVDGDVGVDAGRAIDGGDDDESESAGVPIAAWIDEARAREKVAVTEGERNAVAGDVQRASAQQGEASPAQETQLVAETGTDNDTDTDTDEDERQADSTTISTTTTTTTTSDASSPVTAPPSAYVRGLETLKDGRKAFAAADYPAADALLAQADACFQDAIQEHETKGLSDPTPSGLSGPPDRDTEPASAIRAIGNRGNALMVRARTRLMMSNVSIEAGNIAEAQNDEDMAQEMLLQAGRLYRQILELDPTQGKAFVNWGKVICLRAEISQSAEDYEGAYSLFVNASDKFIAAMDTEGGNSSAAVAEAARLAASALVGAYYCASGLGLQDDAFDLLLEAEGLLVGCEKGSEGGELLAEVSRAIKSYREVAER